MGDRREDVLEEVVVLGLPGHLIESVSRRCLVPSLVWSIGPGCKLDDWQVHLEDDLEELKVLERVLDVVRVVDVLLVIFLARLPGQLDHA